MTTPPRHCEEGRSPDEAISLPSTIGSTNQLHPNYRRLPRALRALAMTNDRELFPQRLPRRFAPRNDSTGRPLHSPPRDCHGPLRGPRNDNPWGPMRRKAHNGFWGYPTTTRSFPMTSHTPVIARKDVSPDEAISY